MHEVKHCYMATEVYGDCIATPDWVELELSQ